MFKFEVFFECQTWNSNLEWTLGQVFYSSEVLETILIMIFLLKVSKFHKQIFLFSFEPKNEQNHFLNSALASKMSQIKKMKALYYINQGVFDTIETHFGSFGLKEQLTFCDNFDFKVLFSKSKPKLCIFMFFCKRFEKR